MTPRQYQARHPFDTFRKTRPCFAEVAALFVLLLLTLLDLSIGVVAMAAAMPLVLLCTLPTVAAAAGTAAAVAAADEQSTIPMPRATYPLFHGRMNRGTVHAQ